MTTGEGSRVAGSGRAGADGPVPRGGITGPGGDVAAEWLVLPAGAPPDTGRRCRDDVARLLEAGKFTRDEAAYIERFRLVLLDRTRGIEDASLERVRALCRTWEVRGTPAAVTSHRRVAGPFIVAAKRALYSVIGVLLKDQARRQREFNSEVVACLAELAAAVEDAGRPRLGPRDESREGPSARTSP